MLGFSYNSSKRAKVYKSILYYIFPMTKDKIIAFRYGMPVSNVEKPRPRKRLPEYDECLDEFLRSGSSTWKVNADAFPSKKVKVILSSLKWRVNHVERFKGIDVFLSKNQIYLKNLSRQQKNESSN
jgi:hypothetical protein